jgi:hypothetical protein
LWKKSFKKRKNFSKNQFAMRRVQKCNSADFFSLSSKIGTTIKVLIQSVGVFSISTTSNASRAAERKKHRKAFSSKREEGKKTVTQCICLNIYGALLRGRDEGYGLKELKQKLTLFLSKQRKSFDWFSNSLILMFLPIFLGAKYPLF